MNKSALKKFGWVACLLALLFCDTRAGNPVDSAHLKNIISFNLTTPFDPHFPRLRVGYAFMITPNLSQSMEIGYGKRFLFPDSTFYANNSLSRSYRLWEFRAETRYYFAGIRKHVTPYVGAELYHIHHRQILYDKAYETEHYDEVIYYEQANYRRIKAGFNIKAGVIFRLNPLLALELYGGGGPRYKNNRYTNVIEGGSGSFELFRDLNYYYKEGDHWSMNVTCGLKVDFIF